MEVGGERYYQYNYRYSITTSGSDPWIKMGSDKNHFNISLTVRDRKVIRECPQTTTFLRDWKDIRSGSDPKSFCSSLTPYRWAKPAHVTCRVRVWYFTASPTSPPLKHKPSELGTHTFGVPAAIQKCNVEPDWLEHDACSTNLPKHSASRTGGWRVWLHYSTSRQWCLCHGTLLHIGSRKCTLSGKHPPDPRKERETMLFRSVNSFSL